MTTHRPYLNTEDRRATLLDAFGRLLERKSLDSITMVEVAEDAGVSRALLYKHFPDLGSLVQGFFDDRASRYFSLIDAPAVRAERSTAGAPSVMLAMVSIPASELRAIEVLLADRMQPELQPARERFRQIMIQRWEDLIGGAQDPHLARQLVWLLIGPLVSLALAVQRHDLSFDDADRIWRALLVGPTALILNPAG